MIDVIGASDTEGEMDDEKEHLKVPTPSVTPGSGRKLHPPIIKKV